MRIHVSRLSTEGDTFVTTVEGDDEVKRKFKELLSLRMHFVAVENEVVHSVGHAMELVASLEEVDVIIGKQVAGG